MNAYTCSGHVHIRVEKNAIRCRCAWVKVNLRWPSPRASRRGRKSTEVSRVGCALIFSRIASYIIITSWRCPSRIITNPLPSWESRRSFSWETNMRPWRSPALVVRNRPTQTNYSERWWSLFNLQVFANTRTPWEAKKQSHILMWIS